MDFTGSGPRGDGDDVDAGRCRDDDDGVDDDEGINGDGDDGDAGRGRGDDEDVDGVAAGRGRDDDAGVDGVDASRGRDDAEGADDDDDDTEGVVNDDIDDGDALLPPIFCARLFLLPGARKTNGARADVAGSG